METLALVFGIKIAFTVVWALPLLLSERALNWIGFTAPAPLILWRLLGSAYTALLLGYVFAWVDASQGIYPKTITWVGIVSNGAAFLILIHGAMSGAWRDWGAPARALMWVSMLATSAIALGLMWAGPMH